MARVRHYAPTPIDTDDQFPNELHVCVPAFFY